MECEQNVIRLFWGVKNNVFISVVVHVPPNLLFMGVGEINYVFKMYSLLLKLSVVIYIYI